MSFDWRTYLALAEELAVREDACSRRSAISRAYYAVYHRARALFERDWGSIGERGDSHMAVWKKLQNDGVKGQRKLGADGERLKNLRVRADYREDDDAIVSDENVKQAMELARKTLKLADDEMAIKRGGGVSSR